MCVILTWSSYMLHRFQKCCLQKPLPRTVLNIIYYNTSNLICISLYIWNIVCLSLSINSWDTKAQINQGIEKKKRNNNKKTKTSVGIQIISQYLPFLLDLSKYNFPFSHSSYFNWVKWYFCLYWLMLFSWLLLGCFSARKIEKI